MYARALPHSDSVTFRLITPWVSRQLSRLLDLQVLDGEHNLTSLQRPGDKAGHEFPGPLPDLAAVAHDQGCHPTEVVTMQPSLKSQIIALV